MLIPDFVPKSVMYVGSPVDRLIKGPRHKERMMGTSFALTRLSERIKIPQHYIITARHVINDTADVTGGAIFIRANHRTAGAMWLETPVSNWITGDPNIDVAVLPLALNVENIEFAVIPGQCLATKKALESNKQTVEIGEELAIPGLFEPHYGKRRNIPIVRMGTLAARAEEKLYAEMGKNDFQEINAYLIETRSIGGLSGSPVIIHRYDKDENGEQCSTWGLLGLMQGHYDNYAPATLSPEKESVNMGISIVVPADDIDAVLAHPDILAIEKHAEDESLSRVVRVRVAPQDD